MGLLDEIKAGILGFFNALKDYLKVVIQLLKNPILLVNPQLTTAATVRDALVVLLKNHPNYKDKSDKELYEIVDNLLKGAGPAAAAQFVNLFFVPSREGAEVVGHSLFDNVLKDIEEAWNEELTEEERRLVDELKSKGYKNAEEVVKAKKALVRYLGKNFSLNFYSWLIGVIAELMSLGQIETVSNLIQSWNWGLGFGWLTWIALSSQFSYLIGRPLESYYLWKLRPRDLTVAQYLTLFIRGYISKEELKEALAKLGYPDELVSKLIEVRYRLLTLSQLQTALKEGLITEERFREELKKLGYHPDYINLLVQLTRVTKIQRERDLTKSEILRLYRYKEIDRDEAKQYLIKLGYDEKEAELLLSLEDYRTNSRSKRLSYNLIRRLYYRGIIDENEAREMLKELGYNDVAISKILELWKIEKNRTTVRIPLSIIRLGYMYDVIDKNRVVELLRSRGYPEDVINIYLKVWDYRKARTVRRLSASQILNMYRYNLISKDEAISKLVELGYSRDNAELLIQYASIRPSPRRLRLTRSDVLNALKKGVIDEETARYYLYLLGYNDEEIDILIQTYT